MLTGRFVQVLNLALHDFLTQASMKAFLKESRYWDRIQEVY
jgi:hypothetical protein